MNRLALGSYVGVLVQQLRCELGATALPDPTSPGVSGGAGSSQPVVPALDDLRRLAERDEVARLLEKAYQARQTLISKSVCQGPVSRAGACQAIVSER